MARARKELATPPAGHEEAPITLLYVRPPGRHAIELERRLREIAHRHAPLVEVVVAAELPADLGFELRARFGRPPTVLILRRGEMVGEAMGELLPAREIERVVRRAVEWLDAAV